MGTYRFSAVEVVFAGNDQDQDEVLLGGLVQAGFGKILRVENLETLPRRLRNAAPDLVILQSNPAEAAPLDLCRGLRHNLIGRNPFATVLEWNRQPTEATVQKAAQSGVDALISDPPTVARIIQRVTRFVEQRRPFAVTSDYIGPDRRQAGERDGEGLLLEVPNALKAKATGDAQALATLETDIAAAVVKVDEHRSSCHVERIAYLVAMIEWICKEETAGKAIEPHLAALVSIAGDLSRRVRGSQRDTINRLCRGLCGVAQQMRDTDLVAQSEELAQLRHLARDIATLCRPMMANIDRGPQIATELSI